MSWLAGVWGIAMVAGPAAGGLMVDTEAGQYLAPNASLGAAVASIIAVHVYVPKVKAQSRPPKRRPRAPDGGRGGGQERRRAAPEEPAAPRAVLARGCRCAARGAPLAYYCGLSFATIYYDEVAAVGGGAARGGGLAQSAESGRIALRLRRIARGLPVRRPADALPPRLLEHTHPHICTGVAAVVYASTPLLSLVADNEAALATLLALHLSIQKAVVSACYTTIFVVTNNSVVASERGRLNGLAMAVASAFKAAGRTAPSASRGAHQRHRRRAVRLSFAFLTSGLLMLICDACAVRWIGADYNARPTRPAAACRLRRRRL